MRARDRVLKSLDGVYREAYERAEARGDAEAMERLDIEYQREQLHMEVLLDLRDLLTPPSEPEASTSSSLLDKAEVLRRVVRLR